MEKSGACPYCNVSPKDQHSLFESGVCDGLKSGKLRKIPDSKHLPKRAQVERTGKE